MNFRSRGPDRPELNLIPMIDVLIVLLIFLMLTTSFRRETGLHIRLPESSASANSGAPGIEVMIDGDGRVSIDDVLLEESGTSGLKLQLAAAAPNSGGSVIIRADRRTPHEVVMRVLDAASQLGLTRISFALESAAGSEGPAGPEPRGRSRTPSEGTDDGP